MTDQASFAAFVALSVAVFVPMAVACWRLDRRDQQQRDEEAQKAKGVER